MECLDVLMEFVTELGWVGHVVIIAENYVQVCGLEANNILIICS